MYDLISELSYDYSDYTGFVGEAGKIEFEVSGTPGLASAIAYACNQWVKENNLYMETFGIYQDTEPFFDKYKVYMVFHENYNGLLRASIAPLIYFLIKAICVLAAIFGIIIIAKVIFAPPEPITSPEAIKNYTDLVNAINNSTDPEVRAHASEILLAIAKGASTQLSPDYMKYIAIAAVVVGAVMLLPSIKTLIPGSRQIAKRELRKWKLM